MKTRRYVQVPVRPPRCLFPPAQTKPIPPAVTTTINKECCGNIRIQGNQPGFSIWEMDVETKIDLAQISVFSSANSTQPLDVDIEIVGAERRRLSVPAGSTINYIGQNVKSITISAQGNDMTFVEGKYAISTTLQIVDCNPCMEPE